MLLKVLDKKMVVYGNKQLTDFLSVDQNTAGKLGHNPATEFTVLRGIGSGAEGLVLQCRSQESGLVALKLVCTVEPS
jgi:hypothetical protein